MGAPLHMLEAVLRRWAMHPDRDALALRGGLLTRHYIRPTPRTPDDVDFVATYPADPGRTVSSLREALALDAGDGVRFGALKWAPIWEETPFPGVRIEVPCADTTMAAATVQIDVGYGDQFAPCSVTLDASAGPIHLPAVTAETLAAWKLHGLFERADLVWRPKDLHDLVLLLPACDPARTPDAIARAFADRDAPLFLIHRLIDGPFGTSRRSRTKYDRFRAASPERMLPDALAVLVDQAREAVFDHLPEVPDRPGRGFPPAPTLEAVLAAIRGDRAFRTYDHGGWTVVSYERQSPEVFPDPDRTVTHTARRHAQLRRECRGLTFDAAGRCIARPFHKFFNLDDLDAVPEGWILAKLDGSLVFPTQVNGQWRWRTRRGPSTIADQAAAFAAADPARWGAVLDALNGVTACFEWCSRQHPIVLDHPIDRLVLTGVRRIDDGTYWSPPEVQAFAAAHGIEAVPILGTLPADRDLLDALPGEGAVLQTPDHQLHKVKNTHYRRLHRAIEGPNDRWAVLTLWLDGNTSDVVDVFARRSRPLGPALAQLDRAWSRSVDGLSQVLPDARTPQARKSLAERITHRQGWERRALFEAFDGVPLETALRRALATALARPSKLDLALAWLNLPNWTLP